MYISSLALQPTFHKWYQITAAAVRMENENELQKMIQIINSRKKETWPTFDTFQFTHSMTPSAPKLLQEYFSETLYWNQYSCASSSSNMKGTREENLIFFVTFENNLRKLLT